MAVVVMTALLLYGESAMMSSRCSVLQKNSTATLLQIVMLHGSDCD